MKTVFPVAVVVAMFLPGIALANVSTFIWTYGGGTDPVYAFGTLTATPDVSIAGAYDIIGGPGVPLAPGGTSGGGQGTRIDSTGYGPGTYGVTILPLAGGCSYGLTCSVRTAGGTDLIYDNLLFPNTTVQDSREFAVLDKVTPSF